MSSILEAKRAGYTIRLQGHNVLQGYNVLQGQQRLAGPSVEIAVRAFCRGRPKTRQWRSPVPRSEEKLFAKVNYLTLLGRFRNDAASRMADRGAYPANTG
jgi:hypothetical protein